MNLAKATTVRIHAIDDRWNDCSIESRPLQPKNDFVGLSETWPVFAQIVGNWTWGTLPD
jgi:hypothetical protein